MTPMHDKSPLLTLADMPAALGLLSRLPIRVDTERATARGAAAAWAYPIAGLVLGLIASAVAQIALWLSLPAVLAAGLALATLIITTGAMHEVGLADTADGFWGGWDKNHRLRIMKDSYMGTYGVVALVLSVGLRWQALTLILTTPHFWAMIPAAALISRTVMVPMMAAIPNARTEGLSHSVGRPTTQTALTAIAPGILYLLAFSSLWLIIPAVAAPLMCATIAKAKIGGQTGDVLGATQQTTEIAILLTFAAWLS